MIKIMCNQINMAVIKFLICLFLIISNNFVFSGYNKIIIILYIKCLNMLRRGDMPVST